MEHKDAEMMETDAPATAQPQPEQIDELRELLTTARQLINQGKPSQALQVVMMAAIKRGGDDAGYQILHRAGELFRNTIQQKSAADDLAALFAECAIADVMPSTSESFQSNPSCPSPLIAPDAQETSILSETGRKQIVLDAFADGSSFICLQCGGLVSNHRKDEHYAYWCNSSMAK